MDNTYSIKELEELTGIKVRTIRFYITEQLIPPPDGTGGGASYDDKHLLPLQVIKLLHESQIKLSGIKDILSGMTPEQMRFIMADAETGKRSWDMAALQNWVKPVAPAAAPAPGNFSFANIGSNSIPPQPLTNILSKLTRPAAPEHETWHRLRPIEGVELNIREDIDKKTKDLVMQLVNQLKNRN